MRAHYWLVRPTGRDSVRVERADTALNALAQAFGITDGYAPKYRYLNYGHWEVKDAGTRSWRYLSDRVRRSLIDTPAGWFDPFKTGGKR